MATFSDKTWSGTPMWQIAGELEEKRKQRDAEELRKASTPVAVLNIRMEGDHHLCELTLLIPSKAAMPTEAKPDPTSAGFREVKVRGPRRLSRPEAMKDGFVLREVFHAKGEAEVWKKQCELKTKSWTINELPAATARLEEPADREQRLRLAQRPRGTGWSRQKDADFFVHTHSPMAYNPKKMQYFVIDGTTQQYVPCEPPHDPVDYGIAVSAGASLVGRDDSELTRPDRPRSLLLKELVGTGRAMKKPLFFLDQPASCFVLFEGLRGSNAVDYCSKNFHTKLLTKLSRELQYWTDAMVERLISSIFDELDSEVLQQASTCYDGVSVGVAIVLGNRLIVATLGAVRGLLIKPSGECMVIGEEHYVADEGPERQRLDTAGGEVISDDTNNSAANLLVRRPVCKRQTTPEQDQLCEIRRVIESCPDSFATLGFGADDTVDGKSAKAQYKRLAMKVHPDKAPEQQKSQATEAFAKVEAAVERIEALVAASAESATALHRILESAGEVSFAVMSRSWARAVVDISEDASIEDAERRAEELRDSLRKLGQYESGKLAHPDAIRADQLLDEALEVLRAPVLKEEDGALGAVGVTRALGLRDLKRPRPIVTAEPRIEVVHLTDGGGHQLVLLSSSAAALGDAEVTSRVRGFSRQSKTASLVVAQDAASAKAKCDASQCLASAVVGIFDVAEQKMPEPPTKKAKLEQGDKVRCLHVLLKHQGLKMTADPESAQRLRAKKGTPARTSAQAEKELLEMQRELLKNPNVFHVLARKHSECDSAIQPGHSAGDLGWVSRGTFPNPQMEAVMFALKPYEVSDIISTPRGMHIIQRIA